MNKRIINHLWMWSIIGAGTGLSFLLFPARLLLPRSGMFIFVGFVMLMSFWLYNIIGAIFIKNYANLASLDMKHIVRNGGYGKVVHPTCITLGIIAWGIFFTYPDLRILFSDIWMTAVIYFWIKVEEDTVLSRPKHDTYDNPDPML